jgi:type IV pilus assembly protein PilE
MTKAKPRPSVHGFTLIEILIALAIVGIITAIALTAYRDSQLRAGRTEGKNALMQVVSDQERYYSNNFSYSTKATPLATVPANTLLSLTGKYRVTVAACSGSTIASCFIATATPQSTQTTDTCANLTITSAGVRAASGGTVADCWER